MFLLKYTCETDQRTFLVPHFSFIFINYCCAISFLDWNGWASFFVLVLSFTWFRFLNYEPDPICQVLKRFHEMKKAWYWDIMGSKWRLFFATSEHRKTCLRRKKMSRSRRMNWRPWRSPSVCSEVYTKRLRRFEFLLKSTEFYWIERVGPYTRRFYKSNRTVTGIFSDF